MLCGRGEKMPFRKPSLTKHTGMVGHHLDSNVWLFDYRTDLTDALCDAVGIDLSRRVMTKAQMNKVMSVVKRPRS